MTFVNLQRAHDFCESSGRAHDFCESSARIDSLDCNVDLHLDEVHTAFLDQRFVSFAVLQERVSREVCFNSVFAQATDTQDRLCHLHHMEVISSQAASDS